MRVSPLQQNIEANFVQKNYPMICLMTIFLTKSYSSVVHYVRKSVFLSALLTILVSGIGSTAIAQNGFQKEKANNVDLVSSNELNNEELINGIEKAQNPRIAETDGTRDDSFNTGSAFNLNIYSMAVQDDGKILVGGLFTNYNSLGIMGIVRLKADGSHDDSFNVGSGVNGRVNAIEVQDDGKIILAGYFTDFAGTTVNRIVRLNSDGSIDNTFNIGSGFNNVVTAIALQEDGKIQVVGLFDSYNGTNSNKIIRLNQDGSIDTSFNIGSGFDVLPYAIVIQNDGKSIIGGAFNTFNGSSFSRIVRLNADGSLDDSFSVGSGFNNSVFTLAIQQDGKVLVGGPFSGYNGVGSNKLARLNLDGSLDTSFNFGTGFDNTVEKIVVQHNEKVLVGGGFTGLSGTMAPRIVRLNSDGSKDDSFDVGIGFNGWVYTLTIQNNNKVLVAGDFTGFNSQSAIRIIRLDAEAAPSTTAPTPTYLPENVISVFSDSYTNLTETNLSPFWSQTTEVTFEEISGNNTMKYSNFNYQGIQLDETNYVDVSGMDYLHLDYWSENSTELKVYLISPGPVEVPYSLTVPTSGWNSIDIPLSEFDPVVLSDVFQFKFEGNGTIYLDNLLFFKEEQASSTAGIDWEIQSSAADNQWFDVTYGNELFVAVSNTGVGNRVMTSPDGINWTIRSSATDNNWFGITYGNGLFVAVSYSGTGNRVMTSPDGINWTIRNSPADNQWLDVTYGNGLFVAVANTGIGNRVMTSPDGINWTIRNSAEDNTWYGVTYGNGLFVAVSSAGSANRVMTSSDGITWTARSTPVANDWRSVIYGNGMFVAIASSGSGDRVMTSSDGINWTSRVSSSDNSWFSVTYGSGLFVTVARSGTGNRVMTSPDGINWTSRSSAVDNNWYGVTYGNGLFVAVATSGTGNRVMTSGTFTPEATDTPIITFQADMRSLLKDGIFNPNTEKMTVVGNFDDNVSTDWSTHFELTEGEMVDSIWTTSVQINNPNPSFSYKYKILSDNVTNYYNSGWDSPSYWLGDNRSQDKPETNLVLDPVFPAIHLINAEPNNRIDNAFYLPLTETRTFDISGLDDPDFFSITVNEGDIVEILAAPEEGTDLDLDLHVIEFGNFTRIAYSDYNDGLGSEKVVFTVPETADENAQGSKTINFRVAHYSNQTYVSKTNVNSKPRISAESGNYSVSTKALAPQFDGPSEISSQVESDTVVSIFWSEVPGASNYRLSVSRRKNFFQFYASGSITDVEYSGTSAVLNLPTDSVWYYYRVRAFNNTGETSRFSAVDSFYTLNQVQIDLNSDLVAHYTFEGNAVDLTGNNLNGTIIGTVDFPAGRLANSQTAHFDEQGEYISVPDNQLLRLERDLTISAWVNNQNSEINFVFSKVYNSNEGPFTSYGLNTHGNATGADPRFVFSTNTSNSGETFLNDTDQYNYNQWYHVVGTYDGSFMRLYVDGVLKAEEQKVGNIEFTSEAIFIGDNPSSASTYQGHVDDVRLYSRALSLAEISALYALESKESIAVWPGDTNQDTIVSGADLIPIARFYGDVGVASNEGLDWKEIQRLEWDLDGNNPARVFADTDGNGQIEAADVLALYANYGKTVGNPDPVGKMNSIFEEVTVHFSSQILDANHTIVNVVLENPSEVPIQGVAFKFKNSALNLTDNTVTVDYVHPGFTKAMNFFMANSEKHQVDFALGTTSKNIEKVSGLITSFVLKGNAERLELEDSKMITSRVISTNGIAVPVNLKWGAFQTHLEENQEIPKETFVDQNYPNPFNPSTQIRFGLSESATVRLEVFDIQGRRVKSILNETKNAGMYTQLVNMDKGFASGVYFYRLQVLGVNGMHQVFTRKMLLVK